nr:hypothetical protein [Clostridium perfringens]
MTGVNGNSFADRLNRVYGILEVIEEKDSLEEIKEAPVFLYDLERQLHTLKML